MICLMISEDAFFFFYELTKNRHGIVRKNTLMVTLFEGE